MDKYSLEEKNRQNALGYPLSSYKGLALSASTLGLVMSPSLAEQYCMSAKKNRFQHLIVDKGLGID
jgi:hypothetical protein